MLNKPLKLKRVMFNPYKSRLKRKLPPQTQLKKIVIQYLDIARQNILNGYEHTMPRDYFSLCIKREELTLAKIKKRESVNKYKAFKKVEYNRVGYTYKIHCYGWLLSEIGLKYIPSTSLKHKLFAILTTTNKEYRENVN